MCFSLIYDMSTNATKPHDEFFKAALGRKELAIAYLRAFLPEGIVQKLRLSELKPDNSSFITPKLKKVFSDIVYICPYGDEEKEVLLTFLLEHKSSPEKYPHLQPGIRIICEAKWCVFFQVLIFSPVETKIATSSGSP